MQHVVSVGGGFTSTLYTPERVIAQYGAENVTLLMARLPNEDPDVWRLCEAVEREFGVPITYIGHNKTPWEVFFEQRMMGNSRVDPCSRILKREVLRNYLLEHFDPADTTLHVGITWDEQHRMKAICRNWAEIGFRVEAPLLRSFTKSRADMMADCERRFGFVPRLYQYGFHHNNCGGACIKAGMQEWARLLWYLPDVYATWEHGENTFQRENSTDATILREYRNGRMRRLPLRVLRKRCQQWWAGCLPGLPFELLPRVKELNSTPACMFCAAA